VRLDEGDEEPEGGDAGPVDAQRPCRDGDPGDRDRGDLAEVQREQLHDEEDGGDREGDRDATRACDGDARYGTGYQDRERHRRGRHAEGPVAEDPKRQKIERRQR